MDEHTGELLRKIKFGTKSERLKALIDLSRSNAEWEDEEVETTLIDIMDDSNEDADVQLWAYICTV